MGYVGEKQSSIKAELEALLPRLQKFAFALTGTRQAGNELTRNTCQLVLARAAREKGQTPLALWAYTQMHTLWTTRLAVRPKREIAEPELFLSTLPGQQTNAFAAGLAKFIAHLPPHQRATLMLIYGLNLSYDEAAEVFGVHVSIVMTRLVRSHNALGRWLDHRGLSASQPAAPAHYQYPERYAYQDYEEQAA